MRFLGYALLTASVVLSAGGVAYRRPAQAQVAAAEAGADDPEMCPAQTEPTPDSVQRARIGGTAPATPVISLNARGFNYSRPGDPVATPVRLSDEVPAAPRD
jgi:hypothetical protein